MGRNVKSTPSESFRLLAGTKILNGFTLEKKTRAQQAQATSSPRRPQPKEWLRLRPGTSDVDRLDR